MRFIAKLSVLLIMLNLAPGSLAASGVSTVTIADRELTLPVGAQLVENTRLLDDPQSAEPAGHLVVLGALERVNHELEPENSAFVFGTRQAWTWYLPASRRTRDVSRDMTAQLSDLEEAFSCRGRGCGSSSYWANRIFERAILYGPQQYQYYHAYRINQGEETDSYLLVYVAERATRKIYLHIELIEG